MGAAEAVVDAVFASRAAKNVKHAQALQCECSNLFKAKV